jgi:hypothetical protein
MLPLEKEMIRLLMKGATTPLENIQVAFFLVAWPSFLLSVLRTVMNEKEKKGFRRAGNLQSLAQDFAERAEENKETQGRP